MAPHFFCRGDRQAKIPGTSFIAASTRRRLTIALAALALVSVFIVIIAPVASSTDGDGPLRYLTNSWTSVDVTYGRSEQILPDVQMKQAFIYGRWMQALDKETIIAAASVHNRLFDGFQEYEQPYVANRNEDTAGNAPRKTPNLLALHSLLNIWNRSTAAIEADDDIMHTIVTNYVSSPNSIFAADAIVLSLIYNQKTGVERVWDDNAASLARDQSKWRVNIDDDTTQAAVRIQHRPATVQDKAVFLTLYALASVYGIAGVRNVKCLESRSAFLAVVTVVVSAVTLLSGAICATAGLTLSGVPLEALPLIALTQCLRNVMRFVKELDKAYLQEDVLNYSARPVARLHLANFIATAQSILIFALLSRVAPSGLSSFCKFAIVAVIVDLVVFASFLQPAVLTSSRVLTLQGTLDTTHHRTLPRRKKSVYSVYGRSTERRDNATKPGYIGLFGMGLLTITFFSFLGCHFYEGLIIGRGSHGQHLVKAESHPPFIQAQADYSCFHTAISTVNWLQGQETQTLRGLIKLARPNAMEAIIGTHTPVAIMTEPIERCLSMGRNVWNFADVMAVLHSQMLMLLAVLTSLFMLLLAFPEDDSSDDEDKSRHSSAPMVTCLVEDHAIDIFLLESCPRRFLVSVGFDREIRLWDLHQLGATSKLLHQDPQHPIGWPVCMMSLDSQAEWLAIYSKNGQTTLCNCHSGTTVHSFRATPDSRIVAFQFVTVAKQVRSTGSATKLLLVFEDGWMIESDVTDGIAKSVRICTEPVLSAHCSSDPRTTPRLTIITAAKSALVVTLQDGSWLSRPIRLPLFPTDTEARIGLKFSIISSLTGMAFVYADDSNMLHLVNLLSGSLLYSIRMTTCSPPSVQAFHTPPQQCVFCGSVAVKSLSVVYTDTETHKLTMHTISPSNGVQRLVEQICLRPEHGMRDRRCFGLAACSELVHSMRNPGTWEVTGANGIAGVRRCYVPYGKDAKRWDSNAGYKLGPGSIRQRKLQDQKLRQREVEGWEAWTMTAQGATSTHVVTTRLRAVRPGFSCKVAQNAIAVTLANTIVLVQFGSQLRDEEDLAVSRPTHGRLSRQSSRIKRTTA